MASNGQIKIFVLVRWWNFANSGNSGNADVVGSRGMVSGVLCRCCCWSSCRFGAPGVVGGGALRFFASPGVAPQALRAREIYTPPFCKSQKLLKSFFAYIIIGTNHLRVLVAVGWCVTCPLLRAWSSGSHGVQPVVSRLNIVGFGSGTSVCEQTTIPQLCGETKRKKHDTIFECLYPGQIG